jgi:hypothetical protein
MAEVSTRDLAELLASVDDAAHAVWCQAAADRLIEQERQHQETIRLLWCVVRAAGGKVAVENAVVADAPAGFLHMHDDPSLPGRVIEANFNE